MHSMEKPFSAVTSISHDLMGGWWRRRDRKRKSLRTAGDSSNKAPRFLRYFTEWLCGSPAAHLLCRKFGPIWDKKFCQICFNPESFGAEGKHVRSPRNKRNNSSVLSCYQQRVCEAVSSFSFLLRWGFTKSVLLKVLLTWNKSDVTFIFKVPGGSCADWWRANTIILEMMIEVFRSDYKWGPWIIRVL